MFRQDRTNPSTAVSTWKGRKDLPRANPSTAVSAWMNGGLGSAGLSELVGGIRTQYEDSGTTYRVHTFKNNGTLTVTGSGEVEYILVAAGGSVYNGGGGAGGYITGTIELTEGDYSIVVGSGVRYEQTGGDIGAGATASRGNNSTAFGLTAYGGGGGGSGGATADGGSGAGTQGTVTAGSAVLSGAQGNDGTSGYNSSHAGGGGGAGGAGTAGSSSDSGDGGASVTAAFSWDGVTTYFAEGGGGSYSTDQGGTTARFIGGPGAGYDGETSDDVQGYSAAPNFGGGAGGKGNNAGTQSNSYGAIMTESGGGIVMVRVAAE